MREIAVVINYCERRIMMLDAVWRLHLRFAVLVFAPHDIACRRARRNQPVIAGAINFRIFLELNLDAVLKLEPSFSSSSSSKILAALSALVPMFKVKPPSCGLPAF